MTNNQFIIGLVGKKRSGKSTVASFLQNEYDFARMSFKYALLEEVVLYFPDFLKKECEMHNCTPEVLLETKPGSIRQFLQNYGTELRRSSDPNYWVNKWLHNSNRLFLDGKSVVADDVRFENEARAIRLSPSGLLIKIEREGNITTDNHPSEMELENIVVDHTILSKDGDIEGLCQKVKEIIEYETDKRKGTN